MIIIQKNTPDSYWACDSQGHFLVYRNFRFIWQLWRIYFLCQFFLCSFQLSNDRRTFPGGCSSIRYFFWLGEAVISGRQFVLRGHSPVNAVIIFFLVFFCSLEVVLFSRCFWLSNRLCSCIFSRKFGSLTAVLASGDFRHSESD